MSWHNLSVEETLSKLETDQKNGLSESEAKKRIEKYGNNVLKEKKSRSILTMFLSQFKDFMIIILIIAALISGFLGEVIDMVVIFIVILLNAVLGVFQENKAEKALEALKKMSAPNAKVIRGGKRLNLPSEELVPGDIFLLEAGDFIPADARLLEAVNLKVEESSLTGESVPVEKHNLNITKEDVPLGDMKNMVFSTGIVTYGRGIAVITETGMSTQVGKIADMLQSEGDDTTPLQKKLAQLGKILGIVALCICGIIFIMELFQGGFSLEIDKVVDSFMVAVSLAVAAIPEGLPAVVTIVLAIGVQRMVKKNAIVRRLPAVETLGSASIICSDKTGTLTQNRMTVLKTYTANKIEDISSEPGDAQKRLLIYAALCNDAKVTIEDGAEKHYGDPTETALVAAALKAGFKKDHLEREHARVAEIPFDSDRKMMTTVHKFGDKYLSITKGAPDVLLKRCVDFDGLDDAENANSSMAKDALRVLGVAVREFDEMPDLSVEEQRENNLTFIGLLGMIDPPREEVKDAVMLCEKAGIRPIMITGDHADTAAAIASQLGILKKGDKVITGSEVAKMSDEELTKRIHEFSVYARVAPEHKVKIVKAWQESGEIVAMTGDGVNDAPALKTADIGCAMGITGTDVAKGAAHMILTDDNFATIVLAVKEGRGIYSNIIKAVQFLLSSNIGEILTIFVATLLGWGTPLLPIHLLFVNLITDSLPALALGMEPVEDTVMNEKPRSKNEGVFANGLGTIIGLQGIMIGTITLVAFALGYFVLEANNPDSAMRLMRGQTMAFTVLAVSQLFHAFNVKSKRSLFRTGIFNNLYLIGAFLIGLATQLILLEVPFLRSLFKLSTLSLQEWGIVLFLAVSPIIFVEIGKLIIHLFNKNKLKDQK